MVDSARGGSWSSRGREVAVIIIRMHGERGVVSRCFVYNWASGFLSPLHSADGESAYTTPLEVVAQVLERVFALHAPCVMQCSARVHIVDLGSGDGRFCIEAAARGLRAHGIDLDEGAVRSANAAARIAGVDQLATFEHADALGCELPTGTTIFVTYMLPSALPKIAARLQRTHADSQLWSIRWPCELESSGLADQGMRLVEATALRTRRGWSGVCIAMTGRSRLAVQAGAVQIILEGHGTLRQ